MISIGKANEIMFTIVKEENSNYGKVDFILNGQKLVDQKVGNLSFLCVDAEVFNHNFQSSFLDDFFWKNPTYPLLENWNLFFSARSLEDMENPIVTEFNDLFYRAVVSLTSEFFDEYVFVGYNDHVNFSVKAWGKFNSKKVLDFIIDLSIVREVFEELEKELRLILD